MLNTFNFHNAICQLYLNKAVGERLKKSNMRKSSDDYRDAGSKVLELLDQCQQPPSFKLSKRKISPIFI